MSTHSEPVAPRRSSSLLIAALGLAVFAATITQEPRVALLGSLTLVLAVVLAIRDSSTSLATWPNGLAALVLVVWFVPIRLYRLPVDLPFNLEPYRLMLVILVVAVLFSVASGKLQIGAAGHGKPVAALAAVAITSQIVNRGTIDVPGGAPVEFKSLSFFLSFLVIFVLFTSAIGSLGDATKVFAALTLGAGLVAVAAIYESRARVNLFDNLDSWFPLLDRLEREVLELRGGRLRVRASAQHPIALGVALTMVVPISLICAQHAQTRWRRIAWYAGAALCAFGAFVTVSRTVVVMAIVMAVVGVLVRPRQVLRLWPVLLVLPGLAHVVAPGTLGALYKAFFPREGLVTAFQGRAGLPGSGRLADIGTGFDLWREAPLAGNGLGFAATTGGDGVVGAVAGVSVIFDNQYLATLVTLGALGLAATVWFVWGAAIKLVRTARSAPAAFESDLIAACAVSCAGFAGAMVFFDAFAFVQSTFVFVILAAIGLRLRELASSRAQVIPLQQRRRSVAPAEEE